MIRFTIHSFNAMVITVTLILFSVAPGKDTETSKKDPTTKKAEIMVFAAVSLSDAMADLVSAFQMKYQIDVKTNMGSSGTLARQIEQGANPDVFISASKSWMKYVDSLGFIQDDAFSELITNDLVVIAPSDSKLKEFTIDLSLDFVALLTTGRLSMGDPAHVPAGDYGKQALEYYGWYGSLSSKLLPSNDVRSALMVVELGEAPLGIVYNTDAMKSAKVKTVATFPKSSYKPIVYMAGVCNKSEAGYLFFTYINSDEATMVWVRYGFQKL